VSPLTLEEQLLICDALENMRAKVDNGQNELLMHLRSRILNAALIQVLNVEDVPGNY
jgi:hypothetical protein